MTTDKTDYHEAQVMDRIFANSAPDGAVDGVYAMLWNQDPANAPNNANEISGGSYTAQQVQASGWTQTSASAPRTYENSAEVNFGQLDSSSDVTVGGVVLYDGPDSSADNALYADALSGGSTTVSAGDEFKFNAGDLTVSED